MNRIPLHSRLPRTVPISGIRRETDTVRTYTFDCSLGARPGQFVMLWLPGVDEKPFSIARDDGRTTEITVCAVGPMTEALARCGVGDLIGLRGPFGTRFTWDPGSRLALVAGGYGAAPLFFAAHEATKDGCAIDVCVGARDAAHLLYLDAFSALPGCTVRVATDDGSAGRRGYNVEVLSLLLEEPDARIAAILACGPERMLKAVSDRAAAAGVPCQLSLERYMKCGFGLCGQCAVDPQGVRVCVDGPVIGGDDCRKMTEFGAYHRDALGRKRPA